VRRIPRDAVLMGWKEIAGALGYSEDRMRDIAATEDLPVFRMGVDVGEDRGPGAQVVLTGAALHEWARARSLGYSRRSWRLAIADRMRNAFDRVFTGGNSAPVRMAKSA